MNPDQLTSKLYSSLGEPLPLPAEGKTALRHRRLLEFGREDLSLARLAEAHWDAVAILAEAGRLPQPHALYGVWASEVPGTSLAYDPSQEVLNGTKTFCSGGQLLDRALITAGGAEPWLLDVDLREHSKSIRFDDSAWKTTAFAETHTSAVTFNAVHASRKDAVGDQGWYLRRPGFWHGACGPAACWAGGAVGLIDYAGQQSRRDPHTLAHLGAMQANAWALHAYLEKAGDEIDAQPAGGELARIRALTLRHLVEQACTDTLRRLPRAYGPRPLAMDASISRRYQELDLYLRQSHAERDLEALGATFVIPGKGQPGTH